MHDEHGGGRLIVDALQLHGVDQVFLVPGESYLPVLDALHDTPAIRLTVCRQEGGAAMMAEAWGKLTGRPGVCLVTRGPGATNASAGVHVAFQDSTPMILLIGQVGRDMQEREAFQEIDYRRMFGQLAKWVAQIDEPARIPEFLSRAFHTATAGRPGPVVLALPENVLGARVAAPEVRPFQPVIGWPAPTQLEQLRQLLESARRPFLLIGGPGWDATTVERLVEFAERWQLPVGTGFRRQDCFPNDHPNYAGDVGLGINPALRRRIREADLVLALGARLTESETGGYTLLDCPRPAQPLVHVFPDPEELGRVYQPTLAINAPVAAVVEAVQALAPVAEPVWRDWTAAARVDYLHWSTPTVTPGEVQMGEIVAWLRERLPPEAIITNGAGNYAIWVHRFYRYCQYGTELAPQSGSMGYGLPAAIAAALRHPDRPIVCFAGDGCFLMTGQELATAAQYGLKLVVLVINNGMYGTIRMHQEQRYPGRVVGTGLRNPDFAALARAYGASGERIERTADFAPAFERALAANGPALIELVVDPEALTPGQSLSRMRAGGDLSRADA